MIFVLNRFTAEAFGLATAVKEFAAVVERPPYLSAREIDPSLLTNAALRPIGVLKALFSRGHAWHIDDMFAPFCLAMAGLGLLTGRRVIVCPHGMLDRWALHQGRKSAKLASLKFLNTLARLGHLDIHALTPAEARKARFLLSHARQVEIIPNGIPADILDAPEATEPRRTRHGPIVVGCLSRISEKKNQLAVVDFARRLRAARPGLFAHMVFHIDGQVEDQSYADRIAAAIADHGLEASVRLGGAVAFEDRARVLAGYDIFFFPSKSEGMPYVILEAMALGVLPLVSRTSACGFVRPYGGQIYGDLDEAVALLPEDRAALNAQALDVTAFRAAFGTDRLRSFIGDL